MPRLSQSKITSQRFLGGTTHYISEYTLMTVSLIAATISACTMLYSICNLLWGTMLSSYSGVVGLNAAVSFIVFGSLHFVLSTRVRKQEIGTPVMLEHKGRTLVFVLASLTAFAWFTGLLISSLYMLLSPLVQTGSLYGRHLLTSLLPTLLSVAVIALAYASIAKRATSRYVAYYAKLALVVGWVLAVATVSVAVNKKDVKSTLKPGENCTYENYDARRCSYNEYQLYDTQAQNEYQGTVESQ